MARSRGSSFDGSTSARVLLADDNPSMLQAARRILEPEFQVVETVKNGEALLEAADALRPDVLIIDICMGMLNGLEAARLLTRTGSKAKIVFLTVHQDPEFMEEAFSVGALGYVVKPRLGTDLLPAVREALAGRAFVSPHLGSPKR